MIAINKPSGLQVLPGGLFQQRTVLMQLQWKIGIIQHHVVRKKNTRKHIQYPFIAWEEAHQVYYSVRRQRWLKFSSLLILSRAQQMVELRDESEFHKARRISKIYRALVTGVLEKDKFENDLVLIPRKTAWFGYYHDGAFSPVLPPQQTKSDGSHSEIEGAASASYTLTCDDQM